MKHPLEFFVLFIFSIFLKAMENFGFLGAITFPGVLPLLNPTPWLWACMSVLG